MQFGIGLMRSPQMGQNGWDVAANALQTGVGTVQALRERDRKMKQEDEDRDLNRKNIENQIETRTSAANTAKEGTSNDYLRIINQDSQAKATHELNIRELDEKIRANKANEANDRIRANAAKDNAGGAGSTSADIQKINNLTAEKVANGMDPVKAKAEATREVMSTGKTSPANMYTQAMQQEIELWQNSFDNLGKVPDPKTLGEMQARAKQRVMDALKMNEGPKPVTAKGDSNIYPTPEARINAQINQAKAKGATPEMIKKALMEEGVDPKAYGY